MYKKLIAVAAVGFVVAVGVMSFRHVYVDTEPIPIVKESDGSDVVMLGDSITELTTPAILSELPNAYVDGESGTFFMKDCAKGESGISRLETLIEEGNLRDILVFAFGTNLDFSSEEQLSSYMDELLSMVEPTTQVVLTTLYALDYDYSRWNEAIRAEAEKYENVSIADWEQYVETSENPASYIKHEEGNYDVHPTEAGQQLFAHIVAASVNAVTEMQARMP